MSATPARWPLVVVVAVMVMSSQWVHYFSKLCKLVQICSIPLSLFAICKSALYSISLSVPVFRMGAISCCFLWCILVVLQLSDEDQLVIMIIFIIFISLPQDFYRRKDALIDNLRDIKCLRAKHLILRNKMADTSWLPPTVHSLLPWNVSLHVICFN